MERDWKVLLEEWKASGLSANKFAQSKQIPLSSFHTAIRRERAKADKTKLGFVEVKPSTNYKTLKPSLNVNPTAVLKNSTGIILEIYL